MNRIFKKWIKLYRIRIAPEPEKIVVVNVNVLYKRTHHVARAYGIKVRHVDAPKKAWHDYVYGLPYDWSAVTHPDHTPEGYKIFVKKAKRLQRKHGCRTEGSYKIGDVMWSCDKERWYLVDID